MKRVIAFTFFATVIAAGFNNCSKVSFSQGSLSAGVSKSGSPNGTNGVSGTDTGSPSPSDTASPAPSASPSPTPPYVSTGHKPDMCVADDDEDKDMDLDNDDLDVGHHDSGDDDAMSSVAMSSNKDSSKSMMHESGGSSCMNDDGEGDDDSCESDDGRAGHRLGICQFTGQGTALNADSNPVVMQFVSVDKSVDVCVSRNACDNIINAYLNKTNGVVGGAVGGDANHGLVKYVNLSHLGQCQKYSATVKSFTDAQISAEIAKLLAP